MTKDKQAMKNYEDAVASALNVYADTVVEVGEFDADRYEKYLSVLHLIPDDVVLCMAACPIYPQSYQLCVAAMSLQVIGEYSNPAWLKAAEVWGEYEGIWMDIFHMGSFIHNATLEQAFAERLNEIVK